MRLTPQEEDVVRWLYVVAGFSGARLARDFECSVSDIEEIVATGLARALNPTSKAAGRKQKPRQMDFQAVKPQTATPKLDREQLLDIFRRTLTEMP